MMDQEAYPAEMVFGVMVRFEQTIGKLYKAFALYFPQWREFWQQISVEENAHASHLLMIAQRVQTGELAVDLARCDLEQIRQSADYAQSLVQEFQQTPFAMRRALTITGQIESQIVDRHFYRVFDTASEPMQRIFRILNGESAMHAQRVIEMLKQIEG